MTVASPQARRPLSPGARIHATVIPIGNALDLGGGPGVAIWEPKINDAGDVAGMWAPGGNQTTPRGMFYRRGGDIVDIGLPPGCTSLNVNAFAANDHVAGTALGCTIGGQTGEARAFHWNPSLGFQLLNGPAIPLHPFGTSTEGINVNGNGTVVGHSVPAGAAFMTPSNWSSSGVLSQAPQAADMLQESVGTMVVNESGLVAGNASILKTGEPPIPFGTPIGFVWPPGGALQEIRAPQGGSVNVTSIGTTGTVVGMWNLPQNNQARVFRFRAGTFEDLGTLGSTQYVAGVDDNGRIVGTVNVLGFNRVFSWTQSEGMTLVPLPAGVYSMTATAMNRIGTFTGSAYYGPGVAFSREHAYRWSASSGYEDLGFLEAGGGTSARGISVNLGGDVAGFWFGPDGHHWAIWPAANHPPQAVIASVSPAAEGDLVQLDATGSSDPDGNSLTYQWIFPATSGLPTLQGPVQQVRFDDNGDYLVRLVVSDGGSTSEASVTVPVHSVAPTATFVVPATAAADAPITISLTGATDPSQADVTAGLQIAFDCGSGFGAFGPSATTTCTAPSFDRATVRATIRDKDGASATYASVVQSINAMDVQPAQLSLTATNTVSVYLYSTAGFDATATNPATVRMRVDGGASTGASVSQRGAAYMSSVADYNGDGRPDRLFVFLRTALQSAGLDLLHTALTLEDVSGTVSFQAVDPTAPAIRP